SRRDVLKGAAAVTGTALLGAPAIISAQPVTLRYLGTAVNQSKEIAQKVKADLGIVIEYVPVTTDDVSKRIITQPASFDVADAEYFQLRKLIPSGNLIGMDANRIKYADKITPVFTRGEIAGKKIGDQGTAAKKAFDLTMKTLIEAKKAGQFRAFWKDFNESVNLMASGEVVIQSMWSPAVTKVRSMGVPCIYQPLKEGYRAWAAGFGLPKTLTGKKLDAGYEFINWFLSGLGGVFLYRQGYYSAVLETARANMEPYEWAYWMEGKTAEKDIKAPDGTLLEKAGTVRDGGSYEARMGAVACWNAVMDENDYMVRKWNEFIAA